MLCSTAKEIWDGVKEAFSKEDNTAALFHIKGILRDLKQEDKDVTSYYNSLLKFWQQLDLYDQHEWTTPADTLQYKKIVEQDRTYNLLLGLNPIYDGARSRIMATRPLPSLREVFSELKWEESRKVLTNSIPKVDAPLEAAAFVSRPNNADSRPRRNGKLWCDHCNRTGHIRDTCWKIHGKPADWKPRQNRDFNHVAAVVEDVPQAKSEGHTFTREQVIAIQRMLQDCNKDKSNPSSDSHQSGFGIGEDDWQC
ncbi:uncharacterized protein LOC133303456 [Gastrolobium bilobum]|nr:uncharacterized protein LOC133303456 [Gastrolobium bilobum]